MNKYTIINITIVLLYVMLLTYLTALVVIANQDQAQPQQNTTTLVNYRETDCDEIIAKNNAYTGKRELVCEIVLEQEDDNVRIFKGKGALDD